MKTRKVKKANVSETDKPSDSAPFQVGSELNEENAGKSEEPAPAQVKERFQLSFDLKDDGTPDLSAMRDKTKERARQFFTDPRIAQAFGASPVSQASSTVDFFPVAPGEKYSPIIGSMYSTLGMLETFLAERFGKIPGPIAARVFTYTEAEKEALAPVTAKVLNKWAPEWLIKYQDEIALANMLISITLTKCAMAAALAVQMRGTPSPAQTPPAEGEDKAPLTN